MTPRHENPTGPTRADASATDGTPGDAFDDRSGMDESDALFDTAAILQVLDGDIERLRSDGDLDDNLACRFTRVLRVAVARLEAQGSRLMDASVRPLHVGMAATGEGVEP